MSSALGSRPFGTHGLSLVPGPVALVLLDSALARKAAGPQVGTLTTRAGPGEPHPENTLSPTTHECPATPAAASTGTTPATPGPEGQYPGSCGGSSKPPGTPREPKSGARCGQSNLQRVLSCMRQGCGEPASGLEAARTCSLKPPARTYPSAGRAGRPIRTELSGENRSHPSALPR